MGGSNLIDPLIVNAAAEPKPLLSRERDLKFDHLDQRAVPERRSASVASHVAESVIVSGVLMRTFMSLVREPIPLMSRVVWPSALCAM